MDRTVDSVLDAALHAAGSTQVAVSLSGGRSSLTRFGDDRLHQSVDESRWTLVVQAEHPEGDLLRRAMATSTDLSDEGIAEAVERARNAALRARAAQLPALLYPEEAAPMPDVSGAYDMRTAQTGPAWRADFAAEAVLAARQRELLTAGYVRTVDGTTADFGPAQPIAYANTRGLRRQWQPTSVDAAVVMRDAGGASGWSGVWSRRRSEVDAGHMVAEALDICRRARHRDPAPSGRQRVLLMPSAVADLLWFMSQTFSARAVREGTSRLAQHDGSTLLAPRLTLRAAPSDPRLLACPFDSEGHICEPLTLLREGQPIDLARDGRDALADGDPSKGYAPPVGRSGAAVPRGWILEGGEGDVGALLDRNPNTLVVTRLWYNRMVEPYRVRVTGMTRDGFFERRNGAVVRAFEDTRYNVEVFDMLARAVDSSAPVRVRDMLAPALVIDGFPFV